MIKNNLSSVQSNATNLNSALGKLSTTSVVNDSQTTISANANAQAAYQSSASGRISCQSVLKADAGNIKRLGAEFANLDAQISAKISQGLV